MILFFPYFWIVGSDTPNSSIRFLIISTTLLIALIKSDYTIPTTSAKKDENIPDVNDMDDIFANTNDPNLDFDDYQTPVSVLKEQPFSGYIQMYGYSLGIISSEVEKVKEILDRPDVIELIPRDGKFIWGNKIEKAQAQNGIPFDYIPFYYVKSKPVIEGGMIENPTATIGSAGSNNSGQWVVNLDMNNEGTRKWSRFTGANKNKQVAISLDNKVYMSPVIRDKIPSGSTQISGFADANEAKDIANVLQAGELPTPVNIIQERTIGPSLGKDSIDLGKKAIVFGMTLVMIFMIIYYKISGLFTVITIISCLGLLFALMSLLKTTLTLPGVIGIVLTIGMCVDANVLIFERIRENFKIQSDNPKSDGFNAAYITILDSNFTTLFAAIFLFAFGFGPIRGFSISLIIGIISSLIVTYVILKFFLNATPEKYLGLQK